MQAISSVNSHVIQAMLNTIAKLQLLLEQAAGTTTTTSMSSEIAEKDLWKNLQRLITKARNYSENLELTLLEELEIIDDINKEIIQSNFLRQIK